MNDLPEPLYGDYYREIYAKGITGEKPAMPIAWDELERRAQGALDERAVAYVWGGAGTEDTMRANREAFRRWRIVPRYLRDVAVRDHSTTILGTDMPAPILLAPIGVQTLLHEEGERATARAAAAVGLPMIVSTAASSSMEEIAEAGATVNQAAPLWYQLYWPQNRELAASFVKRAEDAGYKALVLTVDNMLVGWKPRDLEQAYSPFLEGVGIAQYTSDPVFRAELEKSPEEDTGAAVGQFLGTVMDPTLTWDDLEWLRETTKLPILLKGVLHPHDARRARDRGIDGLVVSNHGGRQLDGAIAALDALPAIVEEAGDEMAILLDSGIRSGADIVKALALGADAVLVGRPYLWGLALGGHTGVETVLRCLLAEYDLSLALSGHTRPSEVDRDTLAPSPYP